MDIYIQERDGKLICLKSDHNEPIIKVIMEDYLPIWERLICVKCLETNQQIVNILDIDQVQEMINGKRKEKYRQWSSNGLLIIKEFQQKISKIQSKLMKDFEEIQRITDQWINDNENDKQLISLITGLESLNKQRRNIDQSQKINQEYLNKLDSVVQELINNDIKKNYDHLQQLLSNKENNLQEQFNQQKQELQNTSTSQVINIVHQEEDCYAIGFNNSGSIMVAGIGKDMKVWQFEEGKLKEKQRLTGHTDDVNCLAFSKKINWFASGSHDSTILGWKEQNNGQWISCQIEQQHNDSIRCLILNNNEDQLISCSDNTINVWNVNIFSHQLEHNYILDNKHNNNIDCLSMNDTETYLVSCDFDKTIILWNKDDQNKWQYLNEIVNYDYGCRLCFISDYQIVWQQSGNGITHFFEIKNGKILRRSELNLQLNQETQDHGLFPTIFNRKKQIIVQNHNRYVYLLKKKENDKLSLVQNPIDCNVCGNWGSMTEDGEFLAVWNKGTKEFRIHKIIYS